MPLLHQPCRRCLCPAPAPCPPSGTQPCLLFLLLQQPLILVQFLLGRVLSVSSLASKLVLIPRSSVFLGPTGQSRFLWGKLFSAWEASCSCLPCCSKDLGMCLHPVPDITDVARTVSVRSPSGIAAEQRAAGWPAHLWVPLAGRTPSAPSLSLSESLVRVLLLPSH